MSDYYKPFRLKCLEPRELCDTGYKGDSAAKPLKDREIVSSTDYAAARERVRQDPVTRLLRRPCRCDASRVAWGCRAAIC